MKPNNHDKENARRAKEYIKLMDQGTMKKEDLDFVSMIVSNLDDENFAITYKEYSRIETLYYLHKRN